MHCIISGELPGRLHIAAALLTLSAVDLSAHGLHEAIAAIYKGSGEQRLTGALAD